MARDRTMRTAEQISRYLDEHPNAADTLRGVADWWLLHQRLREAYEDVQEALDYLVESGAVRVRLGPDGEPIYSRSTEDRGPH